MRTLLCLLVAAACCLSSCQKLVDEQKRNLLVQAITSGQWEIESYMEGAAALTDQFAGYAFQFTENGTVTGTRDDTAHQGTWTGDMANYSISSYFPNAGEPLNKLNGTWLITDGRLDHVVAEMRVGEEITVLKLKKK